MFSPANIQVGMTVRDRDGERLGAIISVDAGGFFLEKGGLFTRDYRVAFSDVTDIDRDDVYLRESLEEMPGVRASALTERYGRSTQGVALQHDLTGGLGLAPEDLEPGASSHANGRERRQEESISEGEPTVVAVRQPPVMVERRAARDEDDLPRREALSDRDPTARR
ncbi:hypothetical protein ACLESO_35720 [Pyxidicoccus sp. 3LG]